MVQGRLQHDSDLLIDQLRSIDNSRLKEGHLTILDESTMRKVGRAVCDVLGVESRSL